MKVVKNVSLNVTAIILLNGLIMSCSKTETPTTQVALKDAIANSSQNLNNAMTEIAASKAFQLLSVNSGTTLKSGTTATATYTANIPLDLIKGVYNYTPLKTNASRNFNLIRFFTKTPDNSRMIINMPVEKLKNPWVLRDYRASDSTQTNNFTMSVTDYHNNYSNYHNYDYLNIADITIDNTSAGGLNISSIVSPALGTQYASQFAFANGYTAKYQYTSGDTIVSSFGISKAGSVLYEEKLLTIKKDTAKFGREHQYILTIGSVKIVRKSGTPAQVYVNGVLQTKAVIAIVDKDNDEDSEHSICGKRDLQITFDDGTTSAISTLIGNSITNISTLFTSLHQVYFAAYVVDWLGYDIYYKRN